MVSQLQPKSRVFIIVERGAEGCQFREVSEHSIENSSALWLEKKKLFISTRPTSNSNLRIFQKS